MARHPKGVPFSYPGLVDHRMAIPGDSYYWYKVDENFASKASGIVIHHSVTGDVGPDAIAKMHLARWGKDAGVGYHFIIGRNGTTWYVGDLGTWRAHVAGKNDKWIGVCMLGEHHKYQPTKEQYDAAHKLITELQKKWPNLKKIVRHSDLQATACPGKFTNMNYVANGYPVSAKPEQPKVDPNPPVETGAGTPTDMINPEPADPKPIEIPVEEPKEEIKEEKPMESPKFKLNKEDLISLAKGLAITLGGAFLTAIADMLNKIDFGEYAVFAVPFFAFLINVARKWLAGK